MNLSSNINSPENTNPSFMNQPNNPPTLTQNFTEIEAAKWLKVSRITLQRIRLRNEIAFSRVGGTRVIYTLKHLEDYLASRERVAVNAC